MDESRDPTASIGPEPVQQTHADAPNPEAEVEAQVLNPVSAPAPPSTTAAVPLRRTVKREKSSHKETMNGPLYMQASNKVVIVRRVKRKGEGPMKQLARWFVENQIGLSFNLIALLFLTHGMPRARGHTSKYFTLSYYNAETGKYGLGWDDGYFVLFCIVLFTGLRAASMEYLLAPFVKSRGINKRKEITRFSEQAWLLMYYSVFWTLGVYILYGSPYISDLRELWTDWPNRAIDGVMKTYMLAQLAFWVQQIIVINIEERRKDHWQMFTHHIVTISLMYASYRYGYTRVGNLILVLMDVVDLFLPLAKCLKYLGYNTICDYVFGLFMVSWFVARHVLYLIVCHSVWDHSGAQMGGKCYASSNGKTTGPFPAPNELGMYLMEPLWDSDGVVCYNDLIRWSFLSMLLFLQGLTVMWFSMIIRVALRVMRGGNSDDPRSDDEEDELEDEEEVVTYEEAQPLEQEVGVDELDLKNWERRTGVKRQSPSATGVSLPGHSDRKELLGRIGCEKQVE